MLAVASIALVAFMIVVYAFGPSGLGVSPDSVGYREAALSLTKSEGFLGPRGEPFIDQPPLYPAMLAATATVLRVDIERAAVLLHALLFGVVAVLVAVLCQHLTGSWPTAVVAAILIVLSTSFQVSAGYLLSELLFVSLQLAAFLMLAIWASTSRSTILLVGTALASGAASVTRYAGVATICACIVSVLFLSRTDYRERLRNAGMFAIIASMPLGLWFVRTAIVADAPFGHRSVSRFGFLDNIGLTFKTFAALITPQMRDVARANDVATVIAAVVSTAIVGTGVVFAARLRDRRHMLAIIGFALAAYVAFIVSTASIVAYDTIDTRLLMPVLPLIMVLFVAGLWSIRRRAPVLFGVILAFTVAWSVSSAIGTNWRIAQWRADGLSGYSSAIWDSSGVLNAVKVGWRETPERTYSNGDDLLWYRSRLAARRLPKQRNHNSNVVMLGASAVNRSWPISGAYIIWFDKIDREYLFDPGELGAFMNVILIRRFSDGAIYFVQARS